MSAVSVVLVAAGSGTRLGASGPKAFVHLCGQSLLGRALDAALGCADVTRVVVVAPASHLDEARSCASAASLDAAVDVRVVSGGADRKASVRAGLRALPDDASIVLVHDSARALAPSSLFSAVVAAVRGGHPAVVPGMALADTIKRVDAAGFVLETLDRTSLRAIQTPQGFTRELLQRAHSSPVPGDPITDDATIVERMGVDVHVIAGDPLATKITTPADLARAQSLLQTRGAGTLDG